MSIQDIINQLQDMILIYGGRIILTITDGKSEYRIKDITGRQCAKYFEPTDHVAEVIIDIEQHDEVYNRLDIATGRLVQKSKYIDCINCEYFKGEDNYCKKLQINWLPDSFGCNQGKCQTEREEEKCE